jgi:hypothetical protein
MDVKLSINPLGETWTPGNIPVKPGWYSVSCAVSDKSNKGIFPGASYWNGETWDCTSDNVIAFFGSFESKKDAENWAANHDIGIHTMDDWWLCPDWM